jgi:hypothetical protein
MTRRIGAPIGPRGPNKGVTSEIKKTYNHRSYARRHLRQSAEAELRSALVKFCAMPVVHE